MIVGGDGRIQCSTTNMFVGVDLSDRPYLKKARETRNFVFSDFSARPPHQHADDHGGLSGLRLNPESDAVIIASIRLDWMSKLMTNLSERPGIMSVLVDSTGTVLAAPADQASLIGKPIDAVSLIVGRRREGAELERAESARIHVHRTPTGRGALVNFAVIPAPSRASSSASTRAKVTRRSTARSAPPIGSSPFVCLFVLLGALIGAEKLIIQPIEMMTGMARRFGEGDASARVGAQPPAVRIRAAGARLQRDGRPALLARARDWSPPTTGSP